MVKHYFPIDLYFHIPPYIAMILILLISGSNDFFGDAQTVSANLTPPPPCHKHVNSPIIEFSLYKCASHSLRSLKVIITL